MKKLLLITSMMLMFILTYGQTQYDSLNIKFNELKQKQDQLELNIGNFHQLRRDGRALYLPGLVFFVFGSLSALNPDLKELTNALIFGGSALMLAGTITFHVADIHLKKYNRTLQIKKKQRHPEPARF